jgi:UDP-N-acetylmuramate dehydrogenase
VNTDLAFNELLLKNILAEREVSLSNHSTFKIGGPCDLAVFPKNRDELALSLKILKDLDVRHRVIGRGSNILFADAGYDGALVFTSKMCSVAVNSDGVAYAESGATLKSIALAAAKSGLSGLEFAHGIPGSLGGGIFMNAGAYGGEISDVLKYSEYYDTETGEFGRFEHADHEFSYRHSVYADKRELIIVGACFELKEGDSDSIKAQIDEYASKRKNSQPLEYPSAGSVFKRPAPDLFVGKMIEESGLKGYTIGGAQVSEKHAGFIINVGGATAKDVLDLVGHIQGVIRQNYGVEIECEIRRAGTDE